MRILALDPGEKKVGLALSDPTGTLATPLAVWPREEDFWEKLAALIAEKKVEKIAVGVPRGLRGETEQTRAGREFLEEVERKSQLPVVAVEEFFSTKEALARRLSLSKSRRRKPEDAEAAAILLESFLEKN